MNRRLTLAVLPFVCAAIACSSAGSASRPDTGGGPAPSGAGIIANVVGGRMAPGSSVTLETRCYDKAPRFVQAPPPGGPHDWIVGDSTAAIYVTGARPGQCAEGAIPSDGAAVRLTVRVAVDTIAAGERWFLVKTR